MGASAAGPAFCCRACNTKRSTLSQIFGYWPVEMFKQLPEWNQTEFWRSDAKGKSAIQSALAKEVTDHRIEEERTSTGGKYLPQEVWERKGFSTAKILACQDTDFHELLGVTYNLGLKSKTKEEVKGKVWKDIFKAAGNDWIPKDSKKKKKE